MKFNGVAMSSLFQLFMDNEDYNYFSMIQMVCKVIFLTMFCSFYIAYFDFGIISITLLLKKIQRA